MAECQRQSLLDGGLLTPQHSFLMFSRLVKIQLVVNKQLEILI